MSKLFQGRIVWAPFADKNGFNEYPRPVVILTLTSEIPNEAIITGCIASSTSALQSPRPHYWIELPHHRQRLVSTKFDRPTVAMCDWSVKVAKSDIDPKDIGGYVEVVLLEEVVKAYLEYHRHNAPISVEMPPRPES